MGLAMDGMEMDSYKSQISDGVLIVLVQKRNRTCPFLKLHVLVSQFFQSLNVHIPANMGSRGREVLFLELLQV